MPKDIKAIRPPSYRAKLNQIRGVGGEEKALLQRIGNLIDVLTFSQRQSQNPGGRRRQASDEIPAPSNIQVTTITGGIQVSWDPVDMNRDALDFYEVQIAESTTFASSVNFQVVESNISYRASPSSGLLFLRLRSVSKRGKVSEWTPTEQVTVSGATVFEVDQDHIEPENRTTVSPKPTLVGALFSVGAGTKAFVGIGAHVGPSPLSLNDTHPGFKAETKWLRRRHEVSYTLHEAASPYPGFEQRVAPTIGEYIDFDGFYNYNPQFYMNMHILPSHVSDFFVEEELDFAQAVQQLNVEFLRYVPRSVFYAPDFAQNGIVFNATMANIKF